MSVEPVADDAELLDRARDCEATLRLEQRSALLGELERRTVDASMRLQVAAERAIDLARLDQVDEAQRAAEKVLAEAGSGDEVAISRATEALGRALAWQGTSAATLNADRLLRDAADRYAALDRPDWQAGALFLCGSCVHYQSGELTTAGELLGSALELLPDEHPRRPVIVSFYAETLIALGELDEADAVLRAGWRVAGIDAAPRAYLQWSMARLASVRGDAFATQRLLLEAERNTGDWFEIQTGTMFLADGAELLDRVGLRAEAEQYLARAIERGPDDEFVRQAGAALAARGGEPVAALNDLQRLASYDWLEKRLIWRIDALAAYATFRAGRVGAGERAAVALGRAVACGGAQVALVGEADLVSTLLPLAEAAGSEIARQALAPSGQYVVRVLGTVLVTDSRGQRVDIPSGRPAELVRLLAVHPHGLHVEQVLDHFLPDVPVATGRHRLRQVLTRLRSSAGPLVLRDDDQLHLAPAWVDARAFLQAAERVRGAGGVRRVRAALSALACWSGPPLPNDVYAEWAREPRDRLHRQYLALLDLVASDAAHRGSHEEALWALSAAIEQDPDDMGRYPRAAAHLRQLGRHAEAARLVRSGEALLD